VISAKVACPYANPISPVFESKIDSMSLSQDMGHTDARIAPKTLGNAYGRVCERTWLEM
jgi:hypothetical protein